MVTKIRRLLNIFFSKSRTINHEPLNKMSLIVIILVDLFILINVFTGLNDISNWHLSPTEAYPCYAEWKTYQSASSSTKDYEILRRSLIPDNQTFNQARAGRLGQIAQICLTYTTYEDKVKNPDNRSIIQESDRKSEKIASFEQSSNNIRTQYDSTLLEKIAGQTSQQSINTIKAEKAKQELDKNNREVSILNQAIAGLTNRLVTKPESISFIAFLNSSDQFTEAQKGYENASFWYPSIQLVFQSLFLLPLILVGFIVHRFAHRRGYGLMALISWHLLVIFFIPLILKVFEFLQIGIIFSFIFNIVEVLFGKLLFVISYIYILLIPLVGFGIIKFFQKFAFNPKSQVVTRVQNTCCINCAKRIKPDHTYCPYCGYGQELECPNCHNSTYKYLPYCKHCGHPQDPAV